MDNNNSHIQSTSQYILGGEDESNVQNDYQNYEQKKINTHQDPQAADIQQRAGDDEDRKTSKAKSKSLAIFKTKLDGYKIGALKKHYAYPLETYKGVMPSAGFVVISISLSCLLEIAALLKDLEASEQLVKAVDAAIVKAVENLIKKNIANAEEEAEMDGKQQHGLHKTEKTRKQSYLFSVRIAIHDSASNKQHEDQEYLTELSTYSLLNSISILLYGCSVCSAFFSGKYLMDPKKALSEKLDGMIQKTGEDIDSSQNEVGLYDGSLQWALSVKDHAALTTIMIKEKLVQALMGKRDREPEESGHHDRDIEKIHATVQRDLQTPKAVGPSLPPQSAVYESEAPEGTASSEETANPLDECDLQSSEHMSPGDGRTCHQSLKLPLDVSGSSTLRDHLDGVHDLTMVKMATHNTHKKTESSERLPSDCQSDSDLATDDISNSSSEVTHESETGATSHDSSQMLQEDVAEVPNQNSSEITQIVDSEASRQNLPETPHEGQTPAPNQNLPEIMQEEVSEASGECLPKVLQRQESKTVGQNVPTREQGSVAEVSTNSVNELVEAPLHEAVMEEDSTSPPQSVRVHSPVVVSSVGSSDSRYYDCSYFIPQSRSYPHSHEESNLLTDSTSHGYPRERPPVVAYLEDEAVSLVSSDSGLNRPSEPWTLHTSQPAAHGAACVDDFSEQTSCAQSASQRDRDSHSQPQEPVDERGCTSTESQLVLSTQLQTIHSDSTTERSTPSPASLGSEAHHHGDHASPAPIRLPPIVVHAASALPPWAAQTAGIDLSQAVARQFAAVRRRRGTYDESWPNYCDIDPLNMSLAGFYCIGPGRHVRCFYCGLELDHLTTDHNIWDEHVRHRPTCVYLRAIMGEDMVERTQINLEAGQVDTPSSSMEDNSPGQGH